MPTKEECQKAVRSFKAKHAIEAADENVVATMHLMNQHGLDVNAALDQSSRSANDKGIDAWHYASSARELIVYQSKLSDSRGVAARGFSDLSRAREWIESVVVDGHVDQVPANNHCLFNLFTTLGAKREELRRIRFTLISTFDPNELEDTDEFSECQASFVKTPLNKFVKERESGKLRLTAEEYALEAGIPADTKTYTVERIPQTRIDLRATAHLDLAYVTLFSLVQLYRQRGDVLFDKNVRLSLAGNKEARDRLVHPMEDTLEAIVVGRLAPSIFAFYHIGVTIAATAGALEGADVIALEAPSIINGCQTITIAAEFLTGLERKKAVEAIERFKEVKVIAKVVVGTTSDELKEITNANNRQNPIENWQLFSNEPVHIEIETALKDIGVFYERQKGKFDSIMKHTSSAQHYYNTRGTYIRIFDLAQIVALTRRNLQWAAKPSEVFVSKESHDKLFDKYIVRNPRDIVLCWNVFKALKRALNTYLERPTHANSNAPVIFKKPIVRAHVYALGLAHFYQSTNRRWVREEFSSSLSKMANPRLVDDAETFYQRLVGKTRTWYTEESKNLSVEIAKKRLDAFFETLAAELGVSFDGALPFSARAIDWREYEGV